MNEDFLSKKLEERVQANALRSLIVNDGKIDFCSNDYLGIVKNNLLSRSENNTLPHGSTGSRLLSGNNKLVENTENFIAGFHNAHAGLIFNSGYDANIGLLASVPQKDDVIIYDQLSHASIRDGIRLSFATSFSFIHNDIADLEKKLSAASSATQNIFVITESVFSMDGDMAPLEEIAALCERYNAGLIIDEAHATGLIDARGEGLVQKLNLQEKCFARINTFGKACGCHGAIILGSENLKKYLINFARPFIYSTALPPSGVNAIAASYKIFPLMNIERSYLNKLVQLFKESKLKYTLIKSDTPIQAVIIPGNAEVKKTQAILQNNNYDVRAILYPTVPKGSERLRIVLHSYNSIDEVRELIRFLNE
ncbi:MAG TPA: 8-amino-7-oxononanoate synthase [Chitinophagaceae bacterium]|nr:8-amino-7-oxononanoate synthase [Chitinophagaceae bacterium]